MSHISIATGMDTWAYSNLLKKVGIEGRNLPIATPIAIHKITHIDRNFSKNPSPFVSAGFFISLTILLVFLITIPFTLYVNFLEIFYLRFDGIPIPELCNNSKIFSRLFLYSALKILAHRIILILSEITLTAKARQVSSPQFLQLVFGNNLYKSSTFSLPLF